MAASKLPPLEIPLLTFDTSSCDGLQASAVTSSSSLSFFDTYLDSPQLSSNSVGGSPGLNGSKGPCHLTVPVQLRSAFMNSPIFSGNDLSMDSPAFYSMSLDSPAITLSSMASSPSPSRTPHSSPARSPHPMIMDSPIHLDGHQFAFRPSTSPIATMNAMSGPQAYSPCADPNEICPGDAMFSPPVALNQKQKVATPAMVKASTRRRRKPANFKCEFCTADFTAKHNLQNHLRSHKGVREFECSLCGMTFTNPGVRDRHRLKCIPDSADSQ
ncbi:hypothetical protein FISHEDRAFT_56455 [Fistulina hepatica ATCC 64428]|uniref:C2H2-type domain-containing protein n=1 Tax=Fistulina hepatica ATCC 64428 TaxID=1128425 RepID=A0A0D7ALY2_9AGAR|nr:hypothetical protein FISHEDRAFT_56455 [Fistulina hepatica ATCC 64428]